MSDARVPSHRPFHGSFDARHAGVPTRRIRIHALSVSGCVIDSPNPFVFGQRIGLKIDLAGEGWITVNAEALGPRLGGGYAVKFVNLNGANRARIERTIERPLIERSHGAWTLDVR